MAKGIVAVGLWLGLASTAGCGDDLRGAGDGDGAADGGEDDGGDTGDGGDMCDASPPDGAALLDGEWDQRFVLPGVNGEAPGVLATALGPGGVLYAGGFFSHAGRTAARNVAAWSAQSGWTALGDGVDGAVTAAAVGPDGALWVATSNWSSDFTRYYHLVLRWDGAWQPIAEVELPADLAEPQRSGIQRMRFDAGGDLIVAGEFVAIDGVAVSHLAALRGDTWTAIGQAPTRRCTPCRSTAASCAPAACSRRSAASPPRASPAGTAPSGRRAT